jgi:hypothetical protein
MPIGLHSQPRASGVELGANQGYAGGLTILLVIILERPKKKVDTHAKGSSETFENDANRIRLLPCLQLADDGVAHLGLTRQLALTPSLPFSCLSDPLSQHSTLYLYERIVDV